MSGRSRRFTLVELLVVIAIIGILASLLLPSLQKAKQKAMTANCVAIEKSLSTVMFLYSDDFENYAVPASAGAGPSTWYTLLHNLRYTAGELTPGIDKDEAPDTNGNRSYGINCDSSFRDGVSGSTGANPWLWVKIAGHTLNAFGRPTETMYLQDCGGTYGWVVCEWGITSGIWNGIRLSTNRHGNGINVAYLDGHVGYRLFSSIPPSPGDVYWDGN
ncbi:MAG: hypothetical protein A3K19_05920 [Lentisphaerae bacterium RIFOXYB12_FULL_65_16]|nr:MAG: hypothetical protein A3K19_05920 [Lentisphaerae bacterium RIFOXYB12_FULL_65_16]